MQVTMNQPVYLDAIIQRLTQTQGRVLLDLLQVNGQVQTFQAKPLANLGNVPKPQFEATA